MRGELLLSSIAATCLYPPSTSSSLFTPTTSSDLYTSTASSSLYTPTLVQYTARSPTSYYTLP